jgi:hypothetical protein
MTKSKAGWLLLEILFWNIVHLIGHCGKTRETNKGHFCFENCAKQAYIRRERSATPSPLLRALLLLLKQ